MTTRLDHPGAAELESYSVDALAADRQQRVGEHVRACEACKGYLAELESERHALQIRLPPPAFAERLTARISASRSGGRWAGFRWGWPMLAGAGAVAILLLGLSWSWFGWMEQPSSPGLRLMGGEQFKVYGKHNDQVSVLLPGQLAAAGDALRVELTVPDARYASVFFMDAKGEVGWMMPESGTADAIRLEAGRLTVPNSVVLDDSVLAERLFVVIGGEPFSPAETAHRVKIAWRASDGLAFGDDHWLPDLPGLTSRVVRR